ncbi:MAG: glycerol kinase GlpK [Candidatus Omnitrophota bacterium]
MKEPVVIALDLGTTGNRAIAFTKDGRPVAQSYYEFPQIFPQAGWVEHDPAQILSTTLQALGDVLKTVGADQVTSIGITNQRETAILWDRRTGQPVHHAIVWQDRRTQDMCRALKAHAAKVKAKTGLFLDPYFSATKIRWMLEHVPDLRERAERGEILFGTPETWVLWNLSGRRIHATEPSNASRTLLFDLKTCAFDPGLLKLFGIPPAILPEVRSSDSSFGTTDPAIAGREIPILGILGDQQAALFAQAGWEQGVIKATYGTGIFVLTGTQEKMCRSDRLITTIGWKLGKKVTYALEGSVFMGGASLQWMRDHLKILSKASESEAIAARLPDNDGVYLVPAFQGLGAPYWDPSARAVIVGLSRKATSDHLIRAAVEAMAYQVQDVIGAMHKAQGTAYRTLRVDGGASANNFLMQFQADISRVSIERPALVELTAFGAAGISGLASGFWKLEDYKALYRTDRVFRPAMSEAAAARSYSKWKEAVTKSFGWA